MTDREPHVAEPITATRCAVKGCPNAGTESFREVAMPWIGARVCKVHSTSWPFTGDFYEPGAPQKGGRE